MRSQNGKLWAYISLGLMGVSGIAAGAYFVLPLILNKDEEIHLTDLGDGKQREATPIAELNDLPIYENSSLVDGQNYLLSDEDGNDSAVFKYLKEFLTERLGFGPEIGLLKSIHLMGVKDNWGSNANGLYIANTNEIIINTYNILKPYINAKAIVSSKKDGNYDKTAVDKDKLSKAIAESIFEVIYHEYGHHMAYCYLNSSYRNDPDYDKHNTTLKSMDDRQKTNTTAWDSTFLKTFKSTLGYDGSKSTNFENKDWTSLIPQDKSYRFPPVDSTDKDTKPYDIYALNSQLDVKTLWDYSNDSSAQDAKTAFDGVFADGKRVRPFGEHSVFIDNSGKFPWVLGDIAKEQIPYYYSQDELFTRKFMQATMPFSDELDSRGLIELDDRRVPNVMSTTLEDTFMYSDSLSSSPTNIFNPDYLFINKIVGDSNGVQVITTDVDNSNAQAIYDAFLDRTGYNDGDDISEIFYQNDVQLKISNGVPVIPKDPTKTAKIKFGGYIGQDILNELGIDRTDTDASNDNLYVGYFDGNKQFHGTKTFYSDYNIKLKSTLTDQKGSIDSASTDSIGYSTDEWVNGNDWKNNQLFFASLDDSGNVIKSSPLKNVNYRASTDVSRWWNDQGKPKNNFQQTAFHPVETNGKVEIEMENNF